MRPLTRLTVLSAFVAVAAAPSALAANSATVSLTPNKGGSLTVAAPTTIKLKASLPDTPVVAGGSLRIKAISAKLPTQFLFNTIPFSQCNSATFKATKTCPSSTKLGTAKVVANGGEGVGDIVATTTLFFGTGFTVLAHVVVTEVANIDEGIVGELRSSGVAGYGLQLYLPISPTIQSPLPDLYPTIKSIDATVKPMTKSVRVPGEKGKVKLPIAGLGPCSGNLNFRVDVIYTDATLTDEVKTDSASAKAKCKK